MLTVTRSYTTAVVVCVLLALLAVAGVSVAAVNVSDSGWSWGNPTPQGRTLRAIAFSGGVGYAVGNGGTVLSTSNAGSSWSGLTTGTIGEPGFRERPPRVVAVVLWVSLYTFSTQALVSPS
jgi:photosystem II stability/assembly factor-like uncharacterized protein